MNTIFSALDIAHLQQEELWPSAMIDGHAHYATGLPLASHSPIDGKSLGQFMPASIDTVTIAVVAAQTAFLQWHNVPAPERGQLLRAIAEQVRAHKKPLAELITLETGKILAEAEGEVQEWLDICDFAVGLSRQLYGLTSVSERRAHRLQEQWHPLGTVGVITAFNFPVAVWAWNAMLAFVCGDSVVWKPSEKTPLCALACLRLVQKAMAAFPAAPTGLLQLVQGRRESGTALAEHPWLPLISATGSVRMGRELAPVVAQRLGRCLLELGGNNAAIITPSADLELALRAVTFAAVGTCGQRCTSLRRLFVQRALMPLVLERLNKIYAALRIGDPRATDILVGPLIDAHALHAMQQALRAAEAEGGEIISGGERIHEGVPEHGHYVRPALVYIERQTAIVREETFAPILYLMPYDDFDEAIAEQNAVSQGLSSALFTRDFLEAEYFLSTLGSDCGIANINAGTSGAEIGLAFGGEKDTGGGREAGSDAWKNYMRRSSNTVNFGSELPLAQGLRFDT